MFQLYSLLLICLFSFTIAHNWISNPPTWNKKWATSRCRGSECTNACPNILEPEEMRNSLSKPGATVKRGGKLKISWVRNNHFGGMFRVSLVPLPYCMDRDAHHRLAIEFGCFESGTYNCRQMGDDCGTDPREAFHRSITIPTTYPDGDYCLGYVWFGGLHYKRRYGGFSDFYSCSIVKIRGGESLGGSFKAQFIAGKGRDEESIQGDKCLTSSTSVGECDRYPCKTSSWYDTPAQTKKKQDSVSVNTVKTYFSNKGGAQHLFEGICRAGVCCDKKCGRCAGSRCSKLQGGSRNCCAKSIKQSGRSCKSNSPPCIMD